MAKIRFKVEEGKWAVIASPLICTTVMFRSASVRIFPGDTYAVLPRIVELRQFGKGMQGDRE